MLLFLLGCKADIESKPDGQALEDGAKEANNEPEPGKEMELSLHENPEPETKRMYVKVRQYGSGLNVRAEPSTGGSIIGRLEHGDRVRVVSSQDGWAAVEWDGGTGYVSMDYLAEEEPDPLTPPADVSSGEVYIHIYKGDRRLELWRGSELIGEYRIGLGFHPVGHKEKEGDGKTPEGSYYVCLRNPNSRFYLSLGISYPGIPDAQRGLEAGLITREEHDRIVRAINSGNTPPWDTALGGQIMIHGSGSHSDWTAGCVAVDNEVMDILWEHCPVGTKIQIYP